MSKSKILFQMTGSIACYKACNVISKLVQAGHEVQVVASASALQFVGEATLEGLTGKPVISDLFERGNIMDHIHLVRWADLIIVAPATANFINKIAQGIGDDLLTTQFLAHDFKKPFLLAPAMNTTMYLHPVTQNSINKLKAMGVAILETASGVLACGEVGWGKLLDPELIYKEIDVALAGSGKNVGTIGGSSTPTSANGTARSASKSKKSSPRILITSGGTQEPIDQVRVLSNMSTGSTGASLAEALVGFGFDVTYLHARNAVQPKADCEKSSFFSFKDLDQELQKLLATGQYAAVIHAAAVSDFAIKSIEAGGVKVTSSDEGKISSDTEVTIQLARNPKLINKLREYAKNPNLLVVAFKMTASENPADHKKAVSKVFENSRADLVVHNDMSDMDWKSGKHAFNFYTQPQSEPQRLDSKQALGQKIGQVLFEKLNKETL